MNRKNKYIIYIAFAVYAILMLWLLYGQRMQFFLSGTWTENYLGELTQKINLIPFRTVEEFLENLHGGGRSHAVINLAGNVIMFIPLGFFIPCIFPKARTFCRSILYALFTIACIEIIQLVTLLGSLDVDDVILNMLGAGIGYWIFAYVKRK